MDFNSDSQVTIINDDNNLHHLPCSCSWFLAFDEAKMWQAAVQLQIGPKRNEERLDEVMKLACLSRNTMLRKHWCQVLIRHLAPIITQRRDKTFHWKQYTPFPGYCKTQTVVVVNHYGAPSTAGTCTPLRQVGPWSCLCFVPWWSWN